MTLTTFGVRIEVTGVGREARRRLPIDVRWDGGVVEGGIIDVIEDGRDLLVRRDGALLLRLATREQAERFAVDEVEHAIAEHSPYVFLHAGAVAIDGVALLIPGTSRSGKSTLVQALLRAGATYYSDEYAVLDSTGHVLPYPRPLSLRVGAGGVERVTAGDLGAAVGDAPARVGAVLLSVYGPAGGDDFVRLGSGDATLAMVEHAVAAQGRPADVLDAVAAVAESAVVLRGTRGEADELAARLVARPPWVSSG